MRFRKLETIPNSVLYPIGTSRIATRNKDHFVSLILHAKCSGPGWQFLSLVLTRSYSVRRQRGELLLDFFGPLSYCVSNCFVINF